MTTASSPASNSTTLSQEWDLFRSLVPRLVNGILNRIFALTIKGSRQRRAVLALLLLFIVAILYLATQGIALWLASLRVFFSSLLTGQPPIQQTAISVLQLVLDPRILRLIPILLLPFLFSREAASRYLADIFELDNEIEDVKIARKFVSEVSLGGADNHLTISVDNFDSDDTKSSPLRMIGGPGRVTVALGTAILVETPDGIPRIIGPAYSEPVQVNQDLASPQLKNKLYQKNNQWHYRSKPRLLFPLKGSSKPRLRKDRNILEGFERIREPIDLRVQMPEALEINARSRDGIPIKVIDARVVFSISRGGRPPTVREPYPFTEQAVLAMVYEKPNRVMDLNSIFEQKSPSVWDAQTTTMKTLLREELSGFMGRHELGEYLASIGEPETEAIKKMAQDISTEKQKISGLETHPINPTSSTASRKSRSELTRLFGDFNGNFNQEQIKRGVEAQWVGVGTWKMPAGIPEKVIPRKHITAWQITLDNMRRGSEQEFKELELNAHAEGIQRLILQAPINTFRETQNPGVNLNRARINLLTAFWQQLNEEIGIRERTGEPVAPSIVVACFKLLLSISHIPYPDIPAPATAREKRAYADLLKRVKIPQAIEKLIDLERRFASNANRTELLERITKAWDADLK